MGGGDKCLLPLAGRPLLAHVVERLRPQVSDLVISANGDPARFSAFGLPVVEDRLDGYAGPLAGIEAGIEWARANRPKTPFLPIDLVRRFRAAIAEWVRQHQAAEVMFPAVEAGGRTIDPFFNINRPDELAAAEAFLQASIV
jgi:molybdenum cofactor guanylyltransferase